MLWSDLGFNQCYGKMSGNLSVTLAPNISHSSDIRGLETAEEWCRRGLRDAYIRWWSRT